MKLRTLFLAILMAAHLPAAVLTYSGMFDSDDGVAFFGFTMDSPGTTEIRTLSAANGGFDPYLSLFDANGMQLLLDLNEDEPGCGCLDSLITLTTPGSYILALTQSGNFPVGPTLADGFSQQGNGNFTGGPFLDVFGDTRTGDWEVEINGPVSAPTGEVPEPATAALLAAGLCALAVIRKRRARQTR